MSEAPDSLHAFQSEPMSLGLIRRERTKDWLRARNKTPADLKRLLNVSSSYISSIIGPNPVRNIGENQARSIEAALGMPHRYLDGESDDLPQARQQMQPIGEQCVVPALVRRKNTTVRDESQALTLSTAILDLAETRPESAAWITIPNAEMGSLLPQGSLALIDISQDTPLDGKVYVLAWKEQFIIRRIHLSPLGYTLTADAGHAPAITLTESDFKNQISVAGRLRLSLSPFQ